MLENQVNSLKIELNRIKQQLVESKQKGEDGLLVELVGGWEMEVKERLEEGRRAREEGTRELNQLKEAQGGLLQVLKAREREIKVLKKFEKSKTRSRCKLVRVGCFSYSKFRGLERGARGVLFCVGKEKALVAESRVIFHLSPDPQIHFCLS